jgi:AcrR family transcriptional regulator
MIGVPKHATKRKSSVLLGRPRTFNFDIALDRALKVFWKKGYEGTSLSDLTQAMGISRPSLYAAFGNKEALFRKVLLRYSDGPAAYVREALDEPSARAVVERLLLGAVDLLSDPRTPPGCLMVQGALSCGDAAAPNWLCVARLASLRCAGGSSGRLPRVTCRTMSTSPIWPVMSQRSSMEWRFKQQEVLVVSNC